MKKLYFLIIILFVLISPKIYSQIKVSENIFSRDSLMSSPPAKLKNIEWIAGNWKGEAFGGEIEESWSPPSENSMMGSFKSMSAGKINFYEFMIIQEINNTLILRLKHFHSDLKGWEEKDVTIDFPLVKTENNKVYFDGYTFEKISDNQINVYALIGPKGSVKEMKFVYSKQP